MLYMVYGYISLYMCIVEISICISFKYKLSKPPNDTIYRLFYLKSYLMAWSTKWIIFYGAQVFTATCEGLAAIGT